jgi:hypothetical protein
VLADRLAGLTDADYTRLPVFAEREAIQREKLNLPLLPTTTIGSFPQTKEIRKNAWLSAKEISQKKNTIHLLKLK